MRRKIRTRLGRIGLLLLLLPGMFLVQAPGGADLLLHEHDSTPVHVHVVAHGAAAHSHPHPHPHSHGSDHGAALRSPDHHDRVEIRFRSPGPLVADSSRSLDTCGWNPARRAIAFVETWFPRSSERARSPDPGSPRTTGRGKHRSGLVSLLSSSRAILI